MSQDPTPTLEELDNQPKQIKPTGAIYIKHDRETDLIALRFTDPEFVVPISPGAAVMMARVLHREAAAAQKSAKAKKAKAKPK